MQKPSYQKTCSAEGCYAACKSLGLCAKHYMRMRNTGSLRTPFNSTPAEKRLRDRLKLNEETGCLEWQGPTSNTGYGQISNRGVAMQAHRLAWELVHGAIPEGLFICHHCDNRRCCNVEHLFIGTQADNMADCVSKDRHAYGSRNGNSKLTRSDVIEIRKRLDSGDVQLDIAADFDVAQTVISNINTKATWSHVK